MSIKMRIARLPLVAAAIALSGCSPEADMQMQRPARLNDPVRSSPAESKIAAPESSRVTVEQIGVFRDELAYGNHRGVYIIKDKKTGAEFIGVSGIGISEVGSHQSGKTQARDER